ncbi:MAG: hypothetical protein IK062_04125 [Selenomonadaceae bacterium]|nr:hypothetical protein [Selenomonadaceae bacterium]
MIDYLSINNFPNNIEMEKDILGAMLVRNGEIIPQLLNIINSDDFYRPEHRVIFDHIVKLYFNGIAPNILSLTEDIRNSDDAKRLDLAYVLNITAWTFTNGYALHHARVIKEKSDLRRLIHLAIKMFEDAQKGVTSVSDIISQVSQSFAELSTDANSASKISSFKNYFTKDFKSEIDISKNYSNRKTGFDNLDQHQIFSTGLYLLGATPAAGKTTFAWQLAEQLARNGETCIYCSYEMSRLELFSKSVARELFKRNSSASLTAADIRRGGWTNQLDNIINENQSLDLDLRTIELHNESIDDLLKILLPLCQSQEKSPIVFIDYLQIIPSSKDNIKNGIDDTVRKLKVFQRETNTTFVVISSFNRSNYVNPVSFESFKESGNIEYTADVVWGLQLNILNQIKGGTTISDTRKKIDDAKKQQPRQVHLKCLKNRQGSNYDCFFNYFSAHDYFEPCKENFTAKNDDDDEDE